MASVLITGCSSGLGYAIALKFARLGHSVYGSVRRTQDAARLQEQGVHPLILDLADQAQIERAVAESLERAGRIDVLVNNAGVALPGALEDLSDKDMQDIMTLNFFAPLHLTRAVLPAMRARRGGHVIMVSSLSALVGLPGEALYCASKAALEAAAEGLRYEVDRFGIHVSVIEPGLFATRMPDKIAEGFRCAPHSPYQPLMEHLRANVCARLQAGDDPQRVAELVVDIAASEKPAFRYPAGEQARRIVPGIPAVDAPARDAFIRSVHGTEWWSEGKDPPA